MHVEYASSYLSYLQAERRRGVSIEVIPDDEDGQLSLAARSTDRSTTGGRRWDWWR